MTKFVFTDDDIKWIKQYRIDHECGLQEAKRVFHRNRVINKITKQNLANESILKDVLLDIMELIR
jgi:ribosomal protein L7/L12